MGSSTSSIPTEPIVAAAALAGALGYGYVHYFRPAAHSGDEDTYSDANARASNAPSTLRGQKKRGRKLHLPGDATLKNLDILDAPVIPGSLSVSTSASSKTRERQRQEPPQAWHEQREREAQAQSPDVVPGGFDGTVTSADGARDKPREQPQPPLEQVQQQQQHVSVGTTKKLKKKKGKKAAATSDPSSASALGASQSLATSTEGVVGKGKKASSASVSVATDAEDAHDERWTRVEARRKKAPVQSQDGSAEMAEATAADVTTSDAGITTSVTGNSSPVTERTTEDELRSDLDECVSFFFLSLLLNSGRPISDMCAFVYYRSALEASPSSLQDAPPPTVPVRPPPGEKPVKGFTWEDYEGVHVDEDASSEEGGGWGVVRSRRSQFLLFSVLSEFIGLKYFLLYRTQQGCVGGCWRSNRYSYHHDGITVTAADEKAAPECAETRGVERGEAGARGAAAGCVGDAQA